MFPSWREAQRTMLTEDTKDAIFCDFEATNEDRPNVHKQLCKVIGVAKDFIILGSKERSINYVQSMQV